MVNNATAVLAIAAVRLSATAASPAACALAQRRDVRYRLML